MLHRVLETADKVIVVRIASVAVTVAIEQYPGASNVFLIFIFSTCPIPTWNTPKHMYNCSCIKIISKILF